MSKPAGKFEFGNKGGFAVGGASAGENVDGIQAGVANMWKPKKKAAKVEEVEEPDEEAEDEDDDEEGGDLADLPRAVIRRVKALRNQHSELEEIEEAYKKERVELEKKFWAQKVQFIEKRTKIISGEVEVPVDPTDETENQVGAEEEEGADTKGVPGFWLTTLTTARETSPLITDEDVPALEALEDITITYNDTWDTFTLTFHFGENEYFTNTTLTKTYTVEPDLLDDKSPALSDIEGCEIDWKPKKNLTVEESTKKQKAKSGRNKGQVKTVTTTKAKHSFFHFFTTPLTEVEADEEDQKEQEDEEYSRVRLTMEEDYDIGHTLRTSIIPEAILFYTGENVDEDDEEIDMDEFEDAEGDEDEEDEEEEDDEEEEAKPAPRKGGKGGKGKGGSSSSAGALNFSAEGGFAASAGSNNVGPDGKPECKQN